MSAGHFAWGLGVTALALGIGLQKLCYKEKHVWEGRHIQQGPAASDIFVMFGCRPSNDIGNAGLAEGVKQAQVMMPELSGESFVTAWHTDPDADSDVDDLLFEALLPGFADQNVRDLQAVIQQLHRQLASGYKELSGHEQRVDVIFEHLKVQLNSFSDHTQQRHGVGH